jgi:hypothetical protein
MISYIMAHPEDFEELIELALLDNQPLSSRAAWLLSHCIENNDSRITKHVTQIINALRIVKGGQQTALIYILRKMEINEEQEGIFFDICVEIWSKLSTIPSARYNAFIFIIKTAKKYPELKNEVTFLSQDFYLESLSKGIKRAAQNLILNLQEEQNSKN